MLDRHLKTMGLHQLPQDLCLYSAKGGESVIITMYVDHILTARESDTTMQDIKSKLMQRFDPKDLKN